MIHMAKRPCLGCKVKLVLKGYCDDCQKKRSPRAITEANRPSAHMRGYTREWSEYSQRRLLENPFCEGLRIEIDGPVKINTHPDRILPATLTDHIEPHKGDQRKFWNPRNHQSGCKDCHDLKTAQEDGGFGRVGSTERGVFA